MDPKFRRDMMNLQIHDNRMKNCQRIYQYFSTFPNQPKIEKRVFILISHLTPLEEYTKRNSPN